MTNAYDLLEAALICLKTVKSEVNIENDSHDLDDLIEKIGLLLKAEQGMRRVKIERYGSKLEELVQDIRQIQWSNVSPPKRPLC